MRVVKRYIQIVTNRVYAAFRSPWFFYVILGLLVLQAGWIAISAVYPQAFDENFHFGLIQLHAQQKLPYFTHKLPGSSVYGAIARDPSYLYHYLLSLLYRVLIHHTESQTAQIIVLRFVNIGLFVGGLFVFRRLFKEMRLSTGVTNTSLFFLVMLPVTPLLAAQINYDNLIFLLTGLFFIYLLRCQRELRGKDSLVLVDLAGLVAVGTLACIVKYSFLPLLATTAVWFVWSFGKRAARSVLQVDASHRPRLLLLTVLAIIGIGLCSERYVENVFTYSSPIPKCDKVLTVDDCLNYSPWARDYLFAQTYPHPKALGIIVYPAVWAHRMVYESLFTINSLFYPEGTVLYFAHDPMPIFNVGAWIIMVVGGCLVLLYSKRIWRQPQLRLLLIMWLAYTAALFIENFGAYLHTGEAVSIHGRYFVPFYPVLFVALIQGYQWGLQRIGKVHWQPILLSVAVLLCLQGGGALDWLSRSDTSWYWPQLQPVARANWLVQDVLHKTVLR